MKAKDIFCIDGEIQFKDGDISLHDANAELAQCLYLTSKGEFKKTPTAGLNIRYYLNYPVSGINQQKFKNDITTALSNDGFDVKDLKVSYNYKLKDYEIKTNVDRIR